MNSYIIMHPFTYNINTSLCYFLGGRLASVEFSPLCGGVGWGGDILTVDGDLDLALVGLGHSVVGDALIVLPLLPLDLCDVDVLPFALAI